MYLAEAPTNASGLTMVIVAVVVLFSLSAWLGLVFLADRPPRGRRAQAIEPKQLNPAEQHDKAA